MKHPPSKHRSFTIRDLDFVDLQVAAALHADAFGFEAWDWKALGEIMVMPTASGRILIDQGQNPTEPLGFCQFLLVAGDAELLTLAVGRRWHRQGVGRRIMDDFLHYAREHGAKNAFLEVAEDNLPAQRLYEGLGFQCEGIRRDYYRRPGNKHVAAKLLTRPIV